MVKVQIKKLLESVLGKGIDKSQGDVWFNCPYCHHPKPKLSINIINQKWQCWVCGKKGRKLVNILKSLQASYNKIKELGKLVGEIDTRTLIKTSHDLALPLEYIPILNGNMKSPDYRNAVKYLKLRGIKKYDILRYSIGYCESGEYGGMIIIPSYDANGELNYFTARSFYDVSFKHKNPQVSKDIIGYDLLVNWNEPINIVEGPFDALTVGENAIPLFGKLIQNTLKHKILQSRVSRVNLLLDADARKKALEHAQYFMNNNIAVHLVDMEGSDPSELGKTKVLEMIENSEQLSFGQLMGYKLYANN
jgi:hypothetical protein|tara:strand:+ start:483 stop:1400 length:918 start_codon:yes stop_codon:yes gene_type:complete